ncbi:MAG: PAS domain-containing protein [Spirochaetales bacterium]|nr:PAS domain-containing protein [Spirochaetales bacterium]
MESLIKHTIPSFFILILVTILSLVLFACGAVLFFVDSEMIPRLISIVLLLLSLMVLPGALFMVRRLRAGLIAISSKDGPLIKADQRENVERLNLAMTGSQDGLWDWDVKTGTFFFDDRYYTMVGYAPREFPMTFEEWEKRVHPEDLDGTLNEIQNCFKGDLDSYLVDYRFLNKNGEYTWIRAKGRPASFDPNGEVTRFIGFHADINNLKKMTEAYQKSSEMLQKVIDNIPQLIYWKNRDFIYQGCNRAFSRILGFEEPEFIIGKSDFDLPSSVSEKKSFREYDARIMDNDLAELHIQEVQMGPDGNPVYLDTCKIPLHDEKGRVIGILGTSENITEKSRMQELLVHNEKMLSVGGLAAGMAHEINNPLAGIIQTSDVLFNRLASTLNIPANRKAAEKAGTSLEAVEEFMRLRQIPRMLLSIQESGRRVGEIVDNMLSFARKSDSSFSTYSINDVLEKTLALAATDYDLKKHYDFKNIEIRKQYEPSLPMVPCEGSKIQQVLFNIIKNAAQAMNEAGIGSPCIEVRTSYKKDKKRAVIEITNNGPGMSEDVRRRVFEPFFTTKPTGEGTGLGLSVSYFIVTENHQGEMEVLSAVDKGVTFIISLPVERV